MFDQTPITRQSDADSATGPRSSRARALTRVDRRLPFGKRIAALKAIFAHALGGEAGLSDLMRIRVDEAAELRALAERERGAYMRGEPGCFLNQIVRLERKASAAEKTLGLDARPPKPTVPTLAAYIAAKTAAKAAAKPRVKRARQASTEAAEC